MKGEVVTYQDVYANQSLKAEFKKYGGGENGMAMLNAKYWLKTSEAAEIFAHHSGGREIECQVNKLLGISNQYVDCELL